MPKYVYRGPADMIVVDGKEYPSIRYDEPMGPGESFEMSELDMINMTLSGGGHQFVLASEHPSNLKMASKKDSEQARRAQRRDAQRMIVRDQALNPEIVAVPSVDSGSALAGTNADGSPR